MTIDEAIEKIEKVLKGASEGQSVVMDIAALQLGVEALKRISLYRKGMYIGLGDKLPGETK